jgi:uncharacterized protein
VIDRRTLLKGLLGIPLAGLAASVYGFFVEPALELRVQRWAIRPQGWPIGQRLRIAILTDLHMSEPYVTLDRLARVVARTNALKPDLTVVLGDLPASSPYVTRAIPPEEACPVLANLSAPLGVHAVLGNHDWWQDRVAQKRRAGPTRAGLALAANGIPVLENRAIRLGSGSAAFWLAGLGDQIAFPDHKGHWTGVDDLPATLAQVTDDAPVILLAHEPDIFPQVPQRVALTLSGHTHGGQVRLFGYSPVVPSDYGNRYAYGPVEEEGHHLVVSGGLGYSGIPVRFGVPPEITVVELG